MANSKEAILNRITIVVYAIAALFVVFSIYNLFIAPTEYVTAHLGETAGFLALFLSPVAVYFLILWLATGKIKQDEP